MVPLDQHGTCGNVYARWWEAYEKTWNVVPRGNHSQYIGMREGSRMIFNNHKTGPANQGAGQIFLRDDCTSGTYSIASQFDLGINQDCSAAYVWNNDASMSVFEQGSMVQTNRDVFVSASQRTALIRCAAIADGGTAGTTSCTTTYNYVPLTYPHLLQGQGP